MKVTRTGRTQTEKTATGIITTAEEIVKVKGKKPFRRWNQIGYTSICQHIVEVNGKDKVVSFVDGAYGQKLFEQGA